jgi:DNA-binding transcriptional ArsR family regulator
MLRIHFTAEDLARTRLTATYGPLAETVLAVGAMHHKQNLFVDGWRDRVLRPRPTWAQPLGELLGPYCTVDLLTPGGRAQSVAEALDGLDAVSPADLAVELDGAVAWESVQFGRPPRPRSSWIRQLPGDRVVRRQLRSFLSECHETAVAPYWDRAVSFLRSEVDRCARVIVEQGVGAFLSTMLPTAEWNSPVLEVCLDGPNRDIHLGGRGLELVPVVFNSHTHVYAAVGSPDAPPVLFYPAVRESAEAARILAPPTLARGNDALTDLLGRTRAVVLSSLTRESSTTELARRAGISIAGASQHASVLRNAGLVETTRDGAAVRHSLTSLGESLLHRYA